MKTWVREVQSHTFLISALGAVYVYTKSRTISETLDTISFFAQLKAQYAIIYCNDFEFL